MGINSPFSATCLLLAFQLFTSVHAASLGTVNAQAPSTTSSPPIQQAIQPTADPIADLFPGTPGSPERASQPSVMTKQPIYESWDVLRQYPRFESLAPAFVPEPKASAPKPDTKEKTDVQ